MRQEIRHSHRIVAGESQVAPVRVHSGSIIRASCSHRQSWAREHQRPGRRERAWSVGVGSQSAGIERFLWRCFRPIACMLPSRTITGFMFTDPERAVID